MEVLKVMQQRHAVRKYLDKVIKSDVKELLEKEIAVCNKESGLHMQLITNEPSAFGSWFTHFGRFSGVNNYIALVAKETPNAYEKCGFYGERIVLYAQALGLNTCWVSTSYKANKDAARLEPGEKLVLVIAIGYGKDSGKASKSKPMEEVANITKGQPEWFIKGVEAALLAPTGMNKQNFYFSLENSNLVACRGGEKLMDNINLGIVKYHFETIAGKDNFSWK